MPRHSRLDAPGTLHHVIIRGLERGGMPDEWTYGPPFGDPAR